MHSIKQGNPRLNPVLRGNTDRQKLYFVKIPVVNISETILC